MAYNRIRFEIQNSATMTLVQGYARLCGILDEFQRWGRSNRDHILPCIIIYSDQKLYSEELDWTKLEKIPRWESFYKIGIRLPEKLLL